MSAPPGERIAALEVKTAEHGKQISEHDQHLKTLDRTLTSLVSEVKGMRYALYVVAASVFTQVFGLDSIVKKVLSLLFPGV
jgi:hypothetical protein